MTLKVLPIHKHQEYLIDCCKLINQEWKRSETARLHSLQQSSDKLPTSLIMLKDKTLIGHLKLSAIPSIRTACFVESVVIEKSLRGQGYGSILMEKAEDFCRNLGLDTIYLSTKGQEQFYSKLDYIECAPVSIYGSFVPKNADTELMKHTGINQVPKDIIVEHFNGKKETGSGRSPPPPPPIPQTAKVNAVKKTFMKKTL